MSDDLVTQKKRMKAAQPTLAYIVLRAIHSTAESRLFHDAGGNSAGVCWRDLEVVCHERKCVQST